ncbi:amidase signature enzyme [Peniophora sp. CONT]|nr:amidase signature enzyme [Peniophora sp. CONT]
MKPALSDQFFEKQELLPRPGIERPPEHAHKATPRTRLIRLFALLILLIYFIKLRVLSAEKSVINAEISSCRVSPWVYDAPCYDLYEASIADLQYGLRFGYFTSVELTKAYLARIDEVNIDGPELRAVLETNPRVLELAAALDAERMVNGTRGPLHGIPILLKDNMATDVEIDGMNTTVGSYALLGSHPPRDSFVATRLREAGAIILGKTNPSEWSHARAMTQVSGWSGRGGQTLNPYFVDGNPSGSSSGSGVAAAVGLAAAALGTETDGSIILPSAANNLVGIKPSVGLTSRAGVIPITHLQDTVGPMARSVKDAALLLGVLAGVDGRDEATLKQPQPIPDYMLALNASGLQGARLGVPRRLFGNATFMTSVNSAFDRALEVLRGLGAEIVDHAELPSTDELLENHSEIDAALVDMKYDIEAYITELTSVPTNVSNLASIVEFNKVHADLELPEPWYASQSDFEQAVNLTKDDKYYAALVENKDLGATRGIDGALKKYNINALVMPSTGYATKAPALAGYPIITVPLGFLGDEEESAPADPVRAYGPGMPFGLSFIGTAWSEFQLIQFAYSYEQATKTRLQRRAFDKAIPKTQILDVM